MQKTLDILPGYIEGFYRFYCQVEQKEHLMFKFSTPSSYTVSLSSHSVSLSFLLHSQVRKSWTITPPKVLVWEG